MFLQLCCWFTCWTSHSCWLIALIAGQNYTGWFSFVLSASILKACTVPFEISRGARGEQQFQRPNPAGKTGRSSGSSTPKLRGFGGCLCGTSWSNAKLALNICFLYPWAPCCYLLSRRQVLANVKCQKCRAQNGNHRHDGRIAGHTSRVSTEGTPLNGWCVCFRLMCVFTSDPNQCHFVKNFKQLLHCGYVLNCKP